MARLERFPSFVLFVFTVAAFINNMALTSPQGISTHDRKPPNLREIPSTTFSCEGRLAGYYADREAQCQVYHMCDTLEQQYSYMCPSYTLFNQKFMVCDHWHAVNCSIADQFYDLNKKIGQVPGEEFTTEEDNMIKGGRKSLNSQKLSSVFKFNVGNVSPLITTTTIKPKLFRETQLTEALPAKRHPSTVTATVITAATTPRTLKSTAQPPGDLLETTPFAHKFITTTEPTSHTSTTQNSNHFFPITLGARRGLSLSARGALKIKFGSGQNDGSNSEKETLQIKLRPLLKESQRSFLDKRNFTVSPDVFRPTTTPSLNNNGDDDDNSDKTGKQHFDVIKPIVSFLIPPLIESPSFSPPTPRTFLVPPVRATPTLFLVPPGRGPIILHGENQEIRTPLVVSNQFFSSKLRFNPPDSEITPPRFPFSRSSRDFFIPSSGFLPAFVDNSLSDEVEGGSFTAPHKMTMTFPNNTMSIRRRRPLKINPKCPRCHPAFLRPNECQPCVIIK